MKSINLIYCRCWTKSVLSANGAVGCKSFPTTVRCCPDKPICASGLFWNGVGCVRCPLCLHGTCDLLTGRCVCEQGWTGANCDSCLVGYFGRSCERCSSCSGFGRCVDGVYGNGTCRCDYGFKLEAGICLKSVLFVELRVIISN